MMFNEIIETFENEDIKKFARICIDNLDPYVLQVSASSTGKYHPQYALNPGGLARHTVAVVRFLNHMFAVECIGNQFTSRERDLLRLAGILHDSKKSGNQIDYEKNKYTKFDHPIIAANHIRKLDGLNKQELEFIAHAIESHMGAFNTDKRYPNIILPKPQDKYQIILHLADYLASRKDIEIKFEGYEAQKTEIPDINNWKFDFGKYTGLTIPEVKAKDPGYIYWAKENMRKEPARTLLKQV